MGNPTAPRPKTAVVRWTMVVLGTLCLAVGGIGIVVPGLPTTVFLILASYFFTRSCPPLDAWMRSSRMSRAFVNEDAGQDPASWAWFSSRSIAFRGDMWRSI